MISKKTRKQKHPEVNVKLSRDQLIALNAIDINVKIKISTSTEY